MKSPIVVVACIAATASAAACDPAKVKGWMTACDSLASNETKCKDKGCHKALHYLIEDAAVKCYVSSGLGPATDLAKYPALDDFCHNSTPTSAPKITKPTSSALSTSALSCVAVACLGLLASLV